MRHWELACVLCLGCSEGGRLLDPPTLSLRFVKAPTSGIEGQPLSPIELEIVGRPNAEVVLRAIDGEGFVSALGRVDAFEGRAVFTGVVLAAGRYMLIGQSDDVESSDRPAIEIAPAAARLSFFVEPTDTWIGAPIEPPVEVEILDRFGARVPLDGVAIALTWSQGPMGISTVQTVGGVAKVPGLVSEEILLGAHLEARATDLGVARSVSVDVSSGACRSQPPRGISVLSTTGLGADPV